MTTLDPQRTSDPSPALGPAATPAARGRVRGRGLWPALALPGTLWLAALFAVPFYAIAAVAFGGKDPIFGFPVPEWDPRYWSYDAFLGGWCLS